MGSWKICMEHREDKAMATSKQNKIHWVDKVAELETDEHDQMAALLVLEFLSFEKQWLHDILFICSLHKKFCVRFCMYNSITKYFHDGSKSFFSTLHVFISILSCFQFLQLLHYCGPHIFAIVIGFVMWKWLCESKDQAGMAYIKLLFCMIVRPHS